MNERVRQILSDFPYYLLARLATLANGFGSLAIFTRFLDPGAYGDYALVMAFVSTSLAFAFAWVNQSILRFYAPSERDDEIGSFYGSITIAYSISLLLLVVLWLFAALAFFAYIDAFPHIIFLWALVLLAGKSVFNATISILRAQRRMASFALVSLCGMIGGLLLVTLLLGVFGSRPRYIFIGMGIGMTVSCVLTLIRQRRQVFFLSSRMPLLREMASYGIPLTAMATITIILSISDRFALSVYHGSNIVGVYSAGYDLVDKSIKALSSLLTATAFPVMMKTLGYEGGHRANLIATHVMRVGLLMFTPIAAGFLVLRSEIINFVLGSQFTEASSFLPLIIAGTYMWALTLIVTQVFQMQSKTMILFRAMLLVVILNLTLNLMLIPDYAAHGAAVSTFISYALYLAILSWSSRQIITWNLDFTFLSKILISISVMVGALLMVGALGESYFVLIVKIFVGSLTYFASLILLKEYYTMTLFNQLCRSCSVTR